MLTKLDIKLNLEDCDKDRKNLLKCKKQQKFVSVFVTMVFCLDVVKQCARFLTHEKKIRLFVFDFHSTINIPLTLSLL